MSEDEKLKIPQIDLHDVAGETSVAPAHAAAVPAVDVMQAELTDDEAEEQLALEQLEMQRKKRRRKKRIRTAAAAAVAVAAVAGWFITHPPVPATDEEAWQPLTAVAYHGDFVTEVSSNGATEPLKLTVVTPEVEGIIQDVRVSEGQQVAEGDVLFTIKNDELDRAIQEAERGVSTAQSALDSAYASQSNAYKAQDEAWAKYNNELEAYNSNSAIIESQNEAYTGTLNSIQQLAETTADMADKARDDSVADDDLPLFEVADDLAHTASEIGAIAGEMPGPVEAPTKPVYEESTINEGINSANSGVESAASGLETANDTLEQAKENAAKRTVKAPSSGTIIAMNAVDGASTAGGQQSTGALVQIADLTQMKVTVQVNEIDIRDIQVGQKGTATFSALPGVELEAVVEKIASMSSGSGDVYGGGGGGVVTYAVDLLIPKPDPALKPGMTATVVIKTQDVPDTIIVPTSSLVDNGDGTFSVNVVTDEETWASEPRTVEVIAQNSSEAAIKGDVADGDLVLMGEAGPGPDEEAMESDVGYGG